jgi:GNAT superfamily N-acetyltransferase
MTTTGRALLRDTKQQAHQRRFTLAVDEAHTLRPVCVAPGHLDGDEVERLTVWRNRFVSAFLHEFVADTQRTARWLGEVVGPDDTRILFMLVDRDDVPRGYLGLGFIEWERNYGEADAIVRGEPLPHGTMRRALRTLLGWARRDLGLGEIGVRVLADNPACEFYRRCGFYDVTRQPLERRLVADGVQWVPGRVADRELIHFRYRESDT